MLRRKYRIAQTGWSLACSASMNVWPLLLYSSSFIISYFLTYITVMLIGFVIFISEFAKIASTQVSHWLQKKRKKREKKTECKNNNHNYLFFEDIKKTLYSESVIAAMNTPSGISYYNSSRDPSLPQQRVLVVVLDGLRYDRIPSPSSYLLSLFLFF